MLHRRTFLSQTDTN